MYISEIKAILEMLLNFDPSNLDKERAIMALFIVKKVYNKLFSKLNKAPQKKVKFSLHPAEAVALLTLLLSNDHDIFQENIIDQIYLLTHQKLA